jgi:hypothetical protein
MNCDKARLGYSDQKVRKEYTVQNLSGFRRNLKNAVRPKRVAHSQGMSHDRPNARDGFGSRFIQREELTPVGILD